MNRDELAGSLLFIGTFVFSMGILVAEALYSGYSISGNYISDLGVGSTAYIFNGTIILLGILVILSAYILHLEHRKEYYPYTLVFLGIGSLAVGLFPETTGAAHLIAALIAFLFSGITDILVFRSVRGFFKLESPAIGIIVLAALVLYVAKDFLGLGVGGMERMIVYPTLLWGMAFSGYLLSQGQVKK